MSKEEAFKQRIGNYIVSRPKDEMSLAGKGSFQKRFSRFCPLRGTPLPPPTPGNGKTTGQKGRFFP